MGSWPQEAAAKPSASAAAWISPWASMQPQKRLSIQRSVIADRHLRRPIAVLNQQEKSLFIKQLNHQTQLRNRKKKRSCVVCFQKNHRGGGGFSHLALYYRGAGVASSFFLFLCEKDGAQQSIAGSGRIQAPFHCRWAQTVCKTLIFLCVLEGQNWNNVLVWSPPQSSIG